ncbi:MAG: FadR/GntR family transcriptional regulator [Pseudonocardia sp.]
MTEASGSSTGSSTGAPPRTSRAQRVAAELETQILTERAPAGTRLGVRTDLIGRFGVSPAVLNEALRILRDRDLVDVRPGPNGGVIVANPPPQVRLGGVDVWFSGLAVTPEQLFEARTYLDALFPAPAMQRADDADLAAMDRALADMRGAGDDARDWLDANIALHLAIARASRIEVLVGLYQSVTTTLRVAVSRVQFVPGSESLRRHNLDVHANLVTAIRERNPVALEKSVALHREDMLRVE